MSEYTKTDCRFYDTDYCVALNAPSCKECVAEQYTAEQMGETQDYIDAVRDLLPDGTVAPLHESDSCLFCRQEPQKKSCYALTDYAHEQPHSYKRNALGIKMKSQVGALLPVQIACCETCRKNFRKVNNIAYVITLVGMAVSLALFMVPAIREALEKLHEVLPVLLFVLLSALSVLLGRLSAVRARQRLGRETVFDANEIPLLARMTQAGWFCATPDSQGRPRLLFSKHCNGKGLSI